MPCEPTGVEVTIKKDTPTCPILRGGEDNMGKLKALIRALYSVAYLGYLRAM